MQQRSRAQVVELVSVRASDGAQTGRIVSGCSASASAGIASQAR
jgi:hypothetical protein